MGEIVQKDQMPILSSAGIEIVEEPSFSTVPASDLPEFKESNGQTVEPPVFDTENIEEVEFSFSALPLDEALFEDPSIWETDESIKITPFDPDSPDYLEGVIALKPMGTIISNVLPENLSSYNQEVLDGINQDYGFLFTKSSQSITDTPLPTTITELERDVSAAVLNQEAYFHSTSGESAGRAYKARIENALELLTDENLDLNDPEIKKMIVSIARQLYAEAALEPNQIPLFHELLQMEQFGRDVTAEQLEQIVASLSPEDIKKLLDGSVVTLEERLISAPKAWVMNKNKQITDDELEILRGKEGVGLKETWGVVNEVWTPQEIQAAEDNFYEKTLYHTDFHLLSVQHGSYDAAIVALSNPYSISETSNFEISSDLPDFTYGTSSYLYGTTQEVLEASGELMEQEKEEKESEAEQQSTSGYEKWINNQLDRALTISGNPDHVIDVSFRDYIPVVDIQDPATQNPILTTHIDLTSTDDKS